LRFPIALRWLEHYGIHVGTDIAANVKDDPLLREIADHSRRECSTADATLALIEHHVVEPLNFLKEKFACHLES